MVRDRLIAFVVCAGLAATSGIGCSGHETTTAEASVAEVKRVPVTVAPAAVRAVERTIELVGTLRGWDEVTVGTKRAGRVAEVLHDIGDRVEPGEPLVKLETTDAELEVLQAARQLRAELAKIGLSDTPTDSFSVESVPSVMQARVSLEQARRELNRRRTLNLRNAASMQEVQDAEDAERIAEASYENAIVGARSTLANALATETALKVVEQALEDTIIRAPIPSRGPNGHEVATITYAITGREVSEGQMLAAGASVMSLAIENPLKLEGDVPERFVAEVKVDQPVSLRVAAYDRPFEGRVVRINPAVDPISRTFGVEALIPNDDGLLRPGSFAKASIVTQRDDEAITVPLESIVTFAGVTKLFEIEDDVAHETQIQTRLEDPDGAWIEVVGSVQPGSMLAISGMSQLAEGTPVVVRESMAIKPPSSDARQGETATSPPRVETQAPPIQAETDRP